MINSPVDAPLLKGQSVGKIIYKVGEREVGSVNAVVSDDIPKISLIYLLNKLINSYLLSV